jgi:hypothetical protein
MSMEHAFNELMELAIDPFATGPAVSRAIGGNLAGVLDVRAGEGSVGPQVVAGGIWYSCTTCGDPGGDPFPED